MSVEALLSVLAFLARAYPDIRAFIEGLTKGEPSAVDRLVATMPQDSASAKLARELNAMPKPRGLLEGVDTRPPEYDKPERD